MNCSHCAGRTDPGPNPYVINIEQTATQNQNFRTAVWTGCHLQMTVMCIPPCSEIGLEIHGDTDQLIRVEIAFQVVPVMLLALNPLFPATYQNSRTSRRLYL